jgi:hypothetical protein
MSRLNTILDIAGMLVGAALVAFLVMLLMGCAPQPVVDIQGAAGRMKVGDTTALIYEAAGDKVRFEVRTARDREGASGSGGLQIKVPVQPLP